MRSGLFIIISFLFLLSCRSHKEISQEVHFSDTTQIIVVDTVHYEDNSIKIVLEPKNDPYFESTDDIIQNINSENFRVRDVEVKRSDLSVSEIIESKSSTTKDITSQIEENEAKIAGKESKERKSLKIVIFVILSAIVSAIAICVYDRINVMRFSNIRTFSREFEKYRTDRWTY